MQSHPNRVLLMLRDTLRSLKRSGACEGSFRLQYAVDKTLRGLDPEYGNTKAHALEAFDDARLDLIESHARTDEEGRTLFEHQETGAVLVQDGDDWVFAEPHQTENENYDPGDHWGGPDRADAESDQLAYLIDDQEALREDLKELRDEETEAEIHTVEGDVLADLDLSGAGRMVDTSVLELMEA